jgi:uroporphyrinogen-III synthase
MSQKLAGRRVLVTRAVSQASRLSAELRALGAIAVEVPLIEIRPPSSFEPLDGALGDLDQYDWLILTSANAARALAERAARLGVSLGRSARLKVAAVGPATAAEARSRQLAVALVAESYVGEGLVAVLGEQTSGRRVLIARAEVARDLIADSLRAAGAEVEVVDAYRNVLPEAAAGQLLRAWEQGIDLATFTSSSSVTRLKEAALKAGLQFPLAGVPAISIGPVTSLTLREQGWEPAAEARRHDMAGLVASVSGFYAD